MADRLICRADDCRKPAITKGLCSAHYTRLLRYGDINVLLVRRGEARKFLETVAIPYDGDDCLIWPFATTKGYPWIKHNGKGAYAHRVICETVHGIPPSEVAVVRHLCGNGHLACVNPKHLAWGTPLQNSADCLAHGRRARGERQGSAKLSENDAREILYLKGKMTGPQLAEKHGVHPKTIYRIWSGTRWGWLT